MKKKKASTPKKRKRARKNKSVADDKKTIFVSVASYRDQELVPSIKDMLKQAHNAQNLRVCICWQHDDSESVDEFKDDSRFLIIDVPHEESKGVCWARNLIQRQYNGEDYILQLDSHHRFAKGWDTVLKSKLSKLKDDGHEKPIISAYLPSYEPDNDPKGRVRQNWRLCFDRFLPEGPIFLRPEHISKNQKGMERGRFISGHMVFADGHYYENVMYDPSLYFHGEETSLGVRSFTHGYDIFHLDRPIIWHFYERAGAVRHWDDHEKWNERNHISFKRFRSLLGVGGDKLEDLGEYGLGKERSLEEFERFAGIDFKTRRVHKDTKKSNPPPINDEDYEDNLMNNFKYCIDLHQNDVPEKDCDFFAVAFTNDEGEEISRLDANESEVASLLKAASSGDGWLRIWREFECVSVPKTWVVWPRSKSKGFLERIEREIDRA